MSEAVSEQCGAIYPLEPDVRCFKHNRCLWPNLHQGLLEKNGQNHFVHWAVTDEEEIEAAQHETMETVLENLRAAQKAVRTLEVSLMAVLSRKKKVSESSK